MEFISLIISMILIGLPNAHGTPLTDHTRDQIILQQIPIQIPENINWKIGDYQERQLLKGFIKGGSLKSWVDREEGDAFWLLNDLKIILKPKQFIELLIDRKTGKVLRYIVDGKEKTPPDLSKSEDCIDIVVVAEKIKIPAGTFDSTRTQIRCPDDSYITWTNTTKVNMGGMIKQAILNEDEDLDDPEYEIELVKYGNSVQ